MNYFLNIAVDDIRIGSFLGGVLFITGLYYICFYLLQKKERHLLYFGLFCIAILFRQLTPLAKDIVVGRAADFSINLIDNISFFVALPLFISFITSLFQNKYSKISKIIFYVISIFLIILNIIGIAKLAALSTILYQIVASLAIIFIFTILIESVRKHEAGAFYTLLGFIIFISLLLIDVVISDFQPKIGFFTQTGIIIFVFSNAYILAYRYYRYIALSSIEKNNLGEFSKGLEARNVILTESNKLKKDLYKNVASIIKSPIDEITTIVKELHSSGRLDKITVHRSVNNLIKIIDNTIIEENLKKLIIHEMSSFAMNYDTIDDLRLYIIDRLEKLFEDNSFIIDELVKIEGVVEENNLTRIRNLVKIQTAASRISSFINNIQNIINIDNETMKIFPEPNVIRRLIAGVMVEARKILNESGKNESLELKCNISDNVPEKCLFDYIQTEMVLNNFLSNAIKHTDKGEIEMLCYMDENEVKIEVRDTGSGIPDDLKETIFSDFGLTSENHNQGLLLSLSKRIIKMQGGNIGFKSTVNLGSIFWITLKHAE